MGQRIADGEEAGSLPLHAPVSGVVEELEEGEEDGLPRAIVLKNDGKDFPTPTWRDNPDYRSWSARRLIEAIRAAGVAGMGGGAVPTHLRLAALRGRTDALLLNGMESEPYLTADRRLMLEEPSDVLRGADVLRRALGVKEVFLCVGNDAPACAEALEEALVRERLTGMTVCVLPSKYPQGYEKLLARVLLGRAKSLRSGVFNVQTAAAAYRAAAFGEPMLTRRVTVAGSAVGNPKNLEARLGTPFRSLIEYVGGFTEPPAALLSGGPMRGRSVPSLDETVGKDTAALLAFAPSERKRGGQPACIGCGRCASVCPIHLMPARVNVYARHGCFAECAALGVSDCIECGACDYVCPAGVSLVSSMRLAKEGLSGGEGEKA